MKTRRKLQIKIKKSLEKITNKIMEFLDSENFTVKSISKFAGRLIIILIAAYFIIQGIINNK